MVGIIDYGSGNFGSVMNAVKAITKDIKTIRGAGDFERCSHIILPGVGAFTAAKQKIEELNIIEELKEQVVQKSKPFLGICVGMQLLAREGHEFEVTNGLDLVGGKVLKFDASQCKFQLPHMGWNDVLNYSDQYLFRNINDDDPSFYFVHSYHLYPDDDRAVYTYSDYGYQFVSAVQKENIFGVQFHPEKSQFNGMRVLENFINIHD